MAETAAIPSVRPDRAGDQGAADTSSPFTPPQISLPKGGGAIRGIGEKFSANAVTGTGSMSIPIPLAQGRSGFTPQLALSYDSGRGNGPFGMGWAVSTAAITRKTDKGLPRYCDSEESDVFILSGAEDLVPVLDRCGHDDSEPVEAERDGYHLRRYRPRIEGLFARIERWTRKTDGDIHWRSISKDNVVTYYGLDAQSRIFDPENPAHVFSWLICQSYDPNGNAILYEYAAETEGEVNHSLANERCRSRSANRYLSRVRYGNRHPLLMDPRSPGFRKSRACAGDIALTQWHFEVLFDYGGVDYAEEPPDERGRIFARTNATDVAQGLGPARRDPFSSYRSGFEVRTYRLCRRVMVFHCFPDELEVERYLVRLLNLHYDEKPFGSFLRGVVQSGCRREADGRYLVSSLPVLELDYSASPLESPAPCDYEVMEAGAGGPAADLPVGIDGADYLWMDLGGEGISGVFSEQGDSWFYMPNLGRGRFGRAEAVSPRPSLLGISDRRVQFMDVDGDGRIDLVELRDSSPGFYERDETGEWRSFRTFASLPVCRWDDPNLRFIDLTGDGIADILITGDDDIWWHRSLLKDGFGFAERVPLPIDEERGSRVVFADGTESIFLADMSGDGLSDIARIRNGEICYWPNLGYGRFGPKITMDNAPRFDDVDIFDQRRVRLADTDGSGTTDIVYFGAEAVHIYLNQAGNSWSGARTLRGFPRTDDLTSVSVVDFLGRGTACLLWSSQLQADWPRRLRYVDLMRGEKPHLLVRSINNLGSETAIKYASSTEFYLADKSAGRPWATRLPFSVHVVERVETIDRIGRNRFVTSYAYHHGYFDAIEREFRGFGMVEQLDCEHVGALDRDPAENENPRDRLPPTTTKTWYHTGAFLRERAISRHLEHEYYREGRASHGEGPLSREQSEALLLDDTVLPSGLRPDEAREACRALKGCLLRQEVYALDGTEKACRPYSVRESNYTIRLLQPRAVNRHAVFFSHPRETLTFSYERALYRVNGVWRADPRVTHEVNLEVDEYGNVLETVSVGYGRRFPDPMPWLTDQHRAEQSRLLISTAQTRYTNAIDEPDAYRTPVLAETSAYEILHAKPAARLPAVTNLFRFAELAAVVRNAGDGRHDRRPEDIEARGAVDDAPWRRLVQSTRMLYRSNALDRLLPLGRLESLALPGGRFRLAFTPGLLRKVYRRSSPGEPHEELLLDASSLLGGAGGYVEFEGDGHWWSPAGSLYYSPDPSDALERELAFALQHFFLPHRFEDPFGNTRTIEYDRYDLAPIESRDAVGNTTRAELDYRVLTPRLMRDANGNRSLAAFDALGMLVGTAVMGKETDRLGDTLDGFVADLDESTILVHMRDPLRAPHALLAGATTRLLYDLSAFERTKTEAEPHPVVIYTLKRETHVSDLRPGQQTKIQHAFSYSDGFGREIQRKLQAEPGPPGADGAPADPRWIGSSWTICNNKGQAVRRYEPFFSATHGFEFAVTEGVSPIIMYDPTGRSVATIHPNHTFEKVVFDPWQMQFWDVNDTVTGNPAEDPDIGGFVSKLPAEDYLPTWLEQRAQGGLGPGERDAAEKTIMHARTPATTYFDPLGRSFLTLALNRTGGDDAEEEHLLTLTVLDIQGKVLSTTDAMGRVIMVSDYNLAGATVRQIGADAGERWMLADAADAPLRRWDSRRHEFIYHYDGLRRPTRLLVARGREPAALVERTIYGEEQSEDQERNLRAHIFQQFDTAGVITNNRYDFKGNLLDSARQLLADYREARVDWSGSPVLEPQCYSTRSSYDALNRTIDATAPDGSIISRHYNEAGLLHRVETTLPGGSSAVPVVIDITHNARGQRQTIAYGNQSRRRYRYDPLTFRLMGTRTTRDADGAILQDFSYGYDPVGNVTQIRDAAQEAFYFNNQVTPAGGSYSYDAIYRLIAAKGREHVSQCLAASPVGFDDSPRMHQPVPGDGRAMRTYRERFVYDAAGNLLQLKHRAANGHWTRTFHYDEAHSHPLNNRLTSSDFGGEAERFEYDAHGNTVRMPQLPTLEWNFKDQLHLICRQAAAEGAGSNTCYTYGAAGMRVRKVTERSSGGKASERLYFGGFELYRKFDPKGAVELERSSLHVMDGERRAALIETKTVDRTKAHRAPVPVIRYQFSDHLDSAALELDDEAAVISYEEYFPYGSTSYQAERFVAEASVKRYRYAAKERDEETGFTYHGARYYAPWLGRWTSADPAGAGGGNNLFLYCGGNPTSRTDVNGSEWCGLTDGFFGLVDSDCHIAPEITRPVKRAAGGAYGALSNFGGFLRLGLWDSWAQSFSSSSEKRIQGAQKSMGEMFDAIGDGRFTDYVADGLSKRGEAIVAAEDKGDYFGSGEVFGDTAMTVYFAGRGGVDMVRGGVGLVTSISEDGVAATLRSTAYGARYWATEFEGVGLRSTPSVSINAARGSIIDNYPTFRAARVIARETALAERTLANGGATNMRSVQAWTRSIGTRWEPARYGSAVNRVVDNAIDANDLGVGVQQRLGTNAKGNPMYPDYQLTAEGNTAVIDITTPGQAGKALKYPANTALEPLTGTSAPGSSISVYLPVALESPAAADLFDLTDEEIRAQACFVH